ncbi:MAG TPA: cobalamin biosynthesis protein, partial [Marinobacter hydrocarbonoclasticus]|nr:cobalamin biosynthesis protein [Marinobacter nauticus]
MDTFLVAVLVCAAAVLLDSLLGEPRRWHPLVGFGRWASLLEHSLNGQQTVALNSWLRGLLATLVAVMPAVVLAILLQWLLEGWLWLLAQIAGVWLAISLRGLAEHGRAVSTALACGDGARARLAVGR